MHFIICRIWCTLFIVTFNFPLAGSKFYLISSYEQFVSKLLCNFAELKHPSVCGKILQQTWTHTLSDGCGESGDTRIPKRNRLTHLHTLHPHSHGVFILLGQSLYAGKHTDGLKTWSLYSPSINNTWLTDESEFKHNDWLTHKRSCHASPLIILNKQVVSCNG